MSYRVGGDSFKGCMPTVVTPRILSRVFLFHFEKISSHFGLFWVFRDVSVNTGRNSRFGRHEVYALKKKILKTKTNLHFVHPKTTKEKKKKTKKKRNEQMYLYNKL